MHYKNSSDQQLWQYCRQDDMKAYNELFDRYAAKLYKQAIRYIKETMIAEELVMDLLFNIWQKRDQPIMEKDVSSYLFRAMRNQVLKHLRKNIPLTTSIDLLEENALVESKQADYNLITADTDRLYQMKLHELSSQRRKVFKLSREENLSYAEIAKEMNLSINTVENYMVAALSALRKSTKECTAITSLIFCLIFL
jgi:RNA polymerase sigma-70 factor (ECF subfamily)